MNPQMLNSGIQHLGILAPSTAFGHFFGVFSVLCAVGYGSGCEKKAAGEGAGGAQVPEGS
jgi:hypothetical protein